VRFHKPSGKTTFECWPRFVDINAEDAEQYPGWPISFLASENDGREPVGYLEVVDLPYEEAVVELTNEATGELVYSYRVEGPTFAAPVYTTDKHTLKVGQNRGDLIILKGAIGN